MHSKTSFCYPVYTCNIWVCHKHVLGNPDVAYRLFQSALDSLRTTVDAENSSDEEETDVEPAPLYEDSLEVCPEESTELGFLTDAGFVNFGHQSALESTDSGLHAQSIESSS